eukprot:UN15073
MPASADVKAKLKDKV